MTPLAFAAFAAAPPKFPPQIAPVMPTMFAAEVVGSINTSSGKVVLEERGTWHYDWPRNRMREPPGLNPQTPGLSYPRPPCNHAKVRESSLIAWQETTLWSL